MNSGIYQIRNLVDNKVYVGSAKNFKRRWSRHQKDFRSDNGHWNIKLKRAANKHGLENMVFEILEKVPYEKEIIIERENYYINNLDSKKHGYNIGDATFGDVLSNHPNKLEIIKKISCTTRKNNDNLGIQGRKIKFGKNGKLNGMFGKIHSKMAKKKISNNVKIHYKNNKHVLAGKTLEQYHGKEKAIGIKNAMSETASKRTGQLNPFYGKIHSKESKKKMSNFRIGKQPGNIKKIVVNEIIYSCRREAEEDTKIKSATLWYRANSLNPKYNNIYFL